MSDVPAPRLPRPGKGQGRATPPIAAQMDAFGERRTIAGTAPRGQRGQMQKQSPTCMKLSLLRTPLAMLIQHAGSHRATIDGGRKRTCAMQKKRQFVGGFFFRQNRKSNQRSGEHHRPKSSTWTRWTAHSLTMRHNRDKTRHLKRAKNRTLVNQSRG